MNPSTTNTTLDTDTTTTNQTSKIKKNVVVYGDYCKKNNQVLLDIFHIVRKKYDNVFFQPYLQDLSKWTVFKNARYAVMWNVYCRYKKKTRYRKIVKKHQSKNKNRLIIVELGFLDRQHYYSLSFDHISNFGTYPDWIYTPSGQKRGAKRLKKMIPPLSRVSSQSPQTKKSQILLCTQVPWDTQVQDIDYYQWVWNTILQLQTDLPSYKLVIRTHPKHTNSQKFPPFTEFLEQKKASFLSTPISTSNPPPLLDFQFSYNTLEQDLETSLFVVAYNSTVLLDALLKGVPVVAASPTSIVWDISSPLQQPLSIPLLPEKKKILECLHRIACKQWRLDEFDKALEYYID